MKFKTALNILIDYLGIENSGTNNDKITWLLSEYMKQELDIFKVPNVQFYKSTPWRNLRGIIFNKYENKCMKCGTHENLSIDHIFPRSLYLELQLEESNMQILCVYCNSSKSNRNNHDYRPL